MPIPGWFNTFSRVDSFAIISHVSHLLQTAVSEDDVTAIVCETVIGQSYLQVNESYPI